jgi:hypothetical protein
MEVESTNPKNDPLHPYGNPCSFCGTEFEEGEWGVMGWIGILPLSLCGDCTAGIYNMVYQTTSIEEFEELINTRKMEEDSVES